MDSSSALQELATRASRYSINLNGEISLIQSNAPLRGSTAIVRKGTLTRGGTEVAVKIFHGTPPGDMDPLKRILREVHLWSKLRHDNVVRMIGISTEFGSTISIVSDWMALGDSHSYIQNVENDPRPLLMDIASGLYYLHSHPLGPIFHGDLKGLNVLVSSDRRALLSDFGLSTLQKCTFSMTVVSPRGGSYPWMAPELLDSYNASTEGDVWAFGMTVLELFTRTIPFPDCPRFENVMYRLITKKLPPRPSEESTLSRMTDAWWEICMSCWRFEPSSRPSMKEIMEKVKSATYRAGPAIVPPKNSMPGFNGIVPNLNPLTSTSMMIHNFLGACTVLRGHDDKVLSVAFSPDGRRMVSGSADNSICLWDIQTRTRVGSPLRGHAGWARSVAYSPDGEWVVSGSYDKTIRLWNVRKGAPAGPSLRGHSSKVLSVAFSPDGSTVVSGSTDQTIRLWDVHAEAQLGLPLEGHTNAIQSVAISWDGTRIVSGSHDKTLRLWDADAGVQIGSALEGHSDGRTVASGSGDHTLRLWDTRAGIPIGRPLIGHSGGVNSVVFSPDGMWVASGSVDTNVFLWDSRTGARVGWVRSVAFSPSTSQIAAGTENGSICLWNARVH
ncbi:WD40-repeat-containing domain protein [Pisolithus albus]|nr:WD40-repeat-containing domain protein [Pisolithus albus]